MALAESGCFNPDDSHTSALDHRLEDGYDLHTRKQKSATLPVVSQVHNPTSQLYVFPGTTLFRQHTRSNLSN